MWRYSEINWRAWDREEWESRNEGGIEIEIERKRGIGKITRREKKERLK